ncbi:MAG TPA: monovalent cation:proton antiporter-2 (CPA2) family protein [Polyangiales bacterium]
MAGEHEAPQYVEALVLLGAAVVAVPVFRKLGLGSILGYLVAGLAIGPFGLRLYGDAQGAMRIAELGVVLFLFIIGLELNVSRLWAMRHDIFVLGTGQVVVTGLLGMLFPLLVVHRPWQSALIAGLGLALSSTALVMQLLEERGEVQQPHGQKAFAILLMQDLAIVPLLALVAALSPSEAAAGADPTWLSAAKMLGAVAAVMLVGRFLLNPLFRLLASAGAHEVMTAAALLVVIGASSLMGLVGLSAALGAFLSGVMLAESSYRHELEADIEPFRSLLLGLFFMSVGMTVDTRLIAANWQVLSAALLSITIIKVSVVYGLMRLLRNAHEPSMRAALLLGQGGEFGFVLFSTAVAARVMVPEQATLLVALVTMSMALTPVLVRMTPLLVGKSQQSEPNETYDGAGGSVLTVGFGRFGQLVCQLLLPMGFDVTIIDNDVEMLEAATRFGFKLYYGDGTRLEVLRAAGAGQARLICICVDRKESANVIVALCRQAFPLAQIYVRAFDRIHAMELLEEGAHFQMRETLESAIAFGRAALLELGIAQERVEEVEEEVRRRDRDRFAMQQQARNDGRDLASLPRPEPFTLPSRQARALNPIGEAES